MLEKVSIIIPFQTDHGPRAEAFEWIKKYYAHVMPEAELCLGIINGEKINKSKAVNSAAKKATRDIFVIADADVVYDPNLIVEAIRLLKKGAWVVPFTEVYNIEKQGTERLLNKKPKWPIDVKSEECTKSNWVYDGFAGKLFVISREDFDAVDGFDERFIGWGGEDDAFSHAVRTICGNIINVRGKIFHLWHPSSSYQKNPNGKANGNLLNRYERASGNKEEMIKLIHERKGDLEKVQNKNIDILNSYENEFMKSPKSKICFAILVHEDKELVKQLIDNVRYYCPNSAFVLYNGGDDRTLCDGLGVPVCPSSRKLKRGWTTIYFLETMEWLEELGIEYEYFINIDSDALFIKKGYEEFIQTEMEDTDYMAVKLRIAEEDWYIAKELKKDIDRWKEFFNVNPFYGVFNVGQVISRPLVKSLLEPERKQRLKKALLKTISFGTDEILFVNMAKELGFRLKKYPNAMDSKMIRYRPYLGRWEDIYDHQDEDNNKTKNQFDSIKSSYLSEQEIKSINSWILKIKNKSNIKETEKMNSHVEKAIITLRIKYKIIGNGKNRIVFDLENGYVLKVALNNWGMKSNKKEYKLFFNSPSHILKHLCPVMEFGYGWIIMKKMTQKIPPDKEYDKKISQLIRIFKENGIEPRDIKEKNLALSENGEFIVIDYGNFVVTGD